MASSTGNTRSPQSRTYGSARCCGQTAPRPRSPATGWWSSIRRSRRRPSGNDPRALSELQRGGDAQHGRILAGGAGQHEAVPEVEAGADGIENAADEHEHSGGVVELAENDAAAPSEAEVERHVDMLDGARAGELD